MPTPRLYTDLAWLWPHLSPPSDYEAEARLLRGLIVQHLGERPRSILELGAGGGHTLVHLSELGTGEHDCVAADLSPTMLEQCRRLIPGIETHLGDMRTMRLGRQFDVVLIHDAIDYMLTEDDLAATLETVREHLVPGGLAFIAPTYLRETFTDGEVADDGTTTDAADLTYFTYVHDPDPHDTTFEMILLYLLRDAQTRQVEVIEDRHTCGLFGYATWMQLMEEAGFRTTYVEDEDDAMAWALFVGVKP